MEVQNTYRGSDASGCTKYLLSSLVYSAQAGLFCQTKKSLLLLKVSQKKISNSPMSQYTLITMTFNRPETECILKNIETAEELTISLKQLAQQGHLLRQLNQGSLAAVLFQLSQEQQQAKH